jgi:hypothetical protein
MGGNQIGKHPGCGDVTLLRNLLKNRPVVFIPEKFAAFRMESKWLVELKIEHGERHMTPRQRNECICRSSIENPIGKIKHDRFRESSFPDGIIKMRSTFNGQSLTSNIAEGMIASVNAVDEIHRTGEKIVPFRKS